MDLLRWLDGYRPNRNGLWLPAPERIASESPPEGGIRRGDEFNAAVDRSLRVEHGSKSRRVPRPPNSRLQRPALRAAAEALAVRAQCHRHKSRDYSGSRAPRPKICVRSHGALGARRLFLRCRLCLRRAYFEAFGIPRHLLHISLDAVFCSGSYLRGAAFLVYGIVNVIAMLWAEASRRSDQDHPSRPAALIALMARPRVRIHAADTIPILVRYWSCFCLNCVAYPCLPGQGLATERFAADETAENPVPRPDALRARSNCSGSARVRPSPGWLLALSSLVPLVRQRRPVRRTSSSLR